MAPASSGSAPSAKHCFRDDGVGHEDERDDTEADRPAMTAGPLVAVIGDQDPAPGRSNADRSGQEDRHSRPLGKAQRDRGRADQQRRGQNGADGHGRKSDGQRHHDQVQQSDQAHRHALHRRKVRIDRAEQQRPIQDANRQKRADPDRERERNDRGGNREHRPEHHGDGGARGAAGRHVQ